jgi:hypothetical protein
MPPPPPADQRRLDDIDNHTRHAGPRQEDRAMIHILGSEFVHFFLL